MKRSVGLGRRRLARLPAVCLAIALCARAMGGEARAVDRPSAAPPLRWAADAEGGAPYVFKDPLAPKRNIGFEVDIAEALAKELGRPIEFVQYTFPRLIPGLLRGDFELAMNGLEITPDRVKLVRFTRPYYVYQLQLVVRADETRFGTLEQCKAIGGRVGTLEDTAAERLLDNLGVAKKLYEGQTEPYLDLEVGRLDAVLLDLPIALYYAQSNKKLKFCGEPSSAGHYAIAVRRGDEELASALDAAMDRLAAAGSLRRIYEKWGLWNAQQEAFFAGRAVETHTAARSEWTVWGSLPLLLEGAWVTVQISVLSMILAVALGLPIATARRSRLRALRAAGTAYVEFFRGIPVLLLLFFLYYGLPTLHPDWKLPAFLAAIVGFGLNYAAYEAEIYRAGIAAVPVGQWEAAASLGMSRGLTFRRIIFPQAVRIILPPMTSDFIALLKDTSLVSVIAVVELTKQYEILAKSSLKYAEMGLATAALYLAMSLPLGCLSRWLEKRSGKGV